MSLGDYFDLLAWPFAVMVAAFFLSRIRITIRRQHD